MSQTELGNELGKTQATVSRWENGQEGIRHSDFVAMRDVFVAKGVNVAPLMSEQRSSTDLAALHGVVTSGGIIRPAEDAERETRVLAPGMKGKRAYVLGGAGALPEGWFIFAEPRREGQSYEDAVDRLSVIACQSGHTILGVVRRGRGEAEHIERAGTPTIFDAVILHASPVLMALPPLARDPG